MAQCSNNFSCFFPAFNNAIAHKNCWFGTLESFADSCLVHAVGCVFCYIFFSGVLSHVTQHLWIVDG